MKKLLQFSINDFTLDEYADHPDVVEELSKRFHTAKEVSESIKFLKEKRKELVLEDIDPLLEELEEIKDSLNWSKSKKGQLILYVNSKYDEWEASVYEEFHVKDIMLRAHVDKLAVCAVGTIDNEANREELIAAIEKLTDLDVLDYLRVKA